MSKDYLENIDQIRNGALLKKKKKKVKFLLLTVMQWEDIVYMKRNC